MPAGRLTADALFAPLADYQKVGLAVSGGGDSLALMLVAAYYAAKHPEGPRFIVYTVDHGLRPEAAGEAAMVIREAEARGLSARLLRWTGRKPKTGIQQAARIARYRLIGEAMAADGAEILVTGHHLHDQAETVMMRLAHGSGLEGLRGMDLFAHVEGVAVCRPFLGLEPAVLLELVEHAGLTPVVDPSNADPGYERVRWRAIMPQLAALGLDAHRIAQFADRMHDLHSALDQMTAHAMRMVKFDAATSVAEFSARGFSDLPRAIGTRLVQQLLNRVGGDQKPHALGAVERLAGQLIHKPVETTLHGCIVRSDGHRIRIVREPLTGARARRREASGDATSN